jgi:hypothetical protein
MDRVLTARLTSPLLPPLDCPGGKQGSSIPRRRRRPRARGARRGGGKERRGDGEHEVGLTADESGWGDGFRRLAWPAGSVPRRRWCSSASPAAGRG